MWSRLVLLHWRVLECAFFKNEGTKERTLEFLKPFNNHQRGREAAAVAAAEECGRPEVSLCARGDSRPRWPWSGGGMWPNCISESH